MPKSDNGLNRPDAWSGTHLFGSFTLAIALMTLFPIREIFDACLIAFCFGLLWECLDQVNLLWWNVDFPFDSRGGSGLDIIFDFIGCAGAGLCLWGLL